MIKIKSKIKKRKKQNYDQITLSLFLKLKLPFRSLPGTAFTGPSAFAGGSFLRPFADPAKKV